MESLRVDVEKRKESIQGQITVIEDKCRLKDTEIKLLDDELMVKKHSAGEQDNEVFFLHLHSCHTCCNWWLTW